MKPVKFSFLALALLYLVCAANVAVATPLETQAQGAVGSLPFEVKAKSVLLMDGNSGEVIYASGENDKAQIASVAKVMSILLFFEAIEKGTLDVNDKVPVSKTAAGMGGTQAFLDEGVEYSVDTLLKTVIVASANDSNIALAEKIAGSEEVFVQKMNERAKELQMNDTHFVNACGYINADQYSTAADLAKAARELMKHKKYLDYSNIWMDSVEHSGGRFSEITNTNKLVRFFQGSEGIATGSDNEAGYCGVYSASRGDYRLIAVLLGAGSGDDRNDGAAKLMEYGFANFVAKRVCKKGDTIKKDVPVADGGVTSINLVTEDALNLMLERGKEKSVKKEIVVQEEISAPIEKGQALGEMIVTVDGIEVGRVNLVAPEAVEATSVINRFMLIVHTWLF